MHVPKTIDNDLILPNKYPSFGFETALHAGTKIVETLLEDAKTCRRWFLATTMGRKAGFLALGIGLAAMSAVGWGLYIVITQHVGDRFSGVDGLAISLPVAAIVTALFGIPQAWGNLTLEVLLVGLVAAILLPLIPWTFELYALRRLTKAAFGTLMALEPAIALVIGALVLRQTPAVPQLVGIGCVVAAGIAAERRGARDDERPDLETPPG